MGTKFLLKKNDIQALFMSLWTSAGRWVPSNSFFLWLLREAKTAVHPLAGLGALPFWLAFCFNVFQMRAECWNTSANVSSSCVGGVLQWHHAVPLLYNQHLAPFLTERIGAKRGKQFSFQFFREGRGRGESTENIFCPVWHPLPLSARTNHFSAVASARLAIVHPNYHFCWDGMNHSVGILLFSLTTDSTQRTGLDKKSNSEAATARRISPFVPVSHFMLIKES